MSGCTVCVYDLHQESMDTYNASVTSLRSKLLSRNIPEREWPLDIRTAGETLQRTEKRENIVLSAFEQMERALKEKQERLKREEDGR